ncbi:MAG TPA: F0F1 ATP synthase subunit A [Opitutaceae bacterium]
MTRLSSIPNKAFSVLGAAFFLMAVPRVQAAGGAAAEHLFNIGPLPVTNSMVTSWVISLILIACIRLAVGRPSLVPSRGQAMVESAVEGILGLIEPIVGKRVVFAAFPVLASLFLFILIQNWSGLLPGVGSLYIYSESTGHWVPMIRPGNADMNGTLALTIVHFAAWLFLVMKYAGPKLIIQDWFGNKADRNEVPVVIYYFLTVIFLFVGVIEVVSVMFRNVSLPFRLFGNVFGGENLLVNMTNLVPWGVPIPFYLLELLVGFVQALVFTLLVSVYIGLLCNHDDDHAHSTEEAHAH